MSKLYEELKLPETIEKKQSREEIAASLESDFSPQVTDKGNPAEKWYLKLEDKSVYGPVALSELSEWAIQCRIGPDHEISTDKQNWHSAKDVPELKMEWMAPLVDGTLYGPLNMFAIHHLIGDGVVASNAELVNRITGETRLAGKLLTPLPIVPPKIVGQQLKKRMNKRRKKPNSSIIIHRSQLFSLLMVSQ